MSNKQKEMKMTNDDDTETDNAMTMNHMNGIATTPAMTGMLRHGQMMSDNMKD